MTTKHTTHTYKKGKEKKKKRWCVCGEHDSPVRLTKTRKVSNWYDTGLHHRALFCIMIAAYWATGGVVWNRKKKDREGV